jgi:hypothetical protein
MSRHKIIFYVEQDEDDYPPFGVETVWASGSGSPGEYLIDNIPFFARQATLGDVVRANQSAAGLEFERVVTRSSNSLLRVIVYALEMAEQVRSRLIELGCSTEVFSGSRLIAVNVPAETSLKSVQDYLSDLEARDVATYERNRPINDPAARI